jgi:flagellar L-ring protein precursor FlgH
VTAAARQAWHRLRAGAALLSALALSGCMWLGPRVQLADTTPPVVQAPPAPVSTNGAIFQAASYRPLFEDHRARLPGDTLTVQIVEKVSATAKSTSSVDKGGTLSASVTALPGVRPAAFARATADGTSANTFEGKGSTESSNDFSGTITVVVRGVLPNGHLLIAGEKQIGVNQNVDVLRFSGQVDPRAIQPGNTVPSASIAHVRLEQRGRGQQAEAQAIGWLSRIFLSVMPI